jgi:hypothetical protein
MLVKKSDSRSRLAVLSLLATRSDTGQHWRGNPRSRWSTVIGSRFSVREQLARRDLQS